MSADPVTTPARPMTFISARSRLRPVKGLSGYRMAAPPSPPPLPPPLPCRPFPNTRSQAPIRSTRRRERRARRTTTSPSDGSGGDDPPPAPRLADRRLP